MGTTLFAMSWFDSIVNHFSHMKPFDIFAASAMLFVFLPALIYCAYLSIKTPEPVRVRVCSHPQCPRRTTTRRN